MTTAFQQLEVERADSSQAHAEIRRLKDHLEQEVIGQKRLIDRLLIALLADGHLLVEGAPGLAKTRAVKTLGNAIAGETRRIQFTPDLLPSVVTGSEIFRPEDGSFRFEPGPIFANFVLADEVNRAPAKVQSALLEAMAERQVTAGNVSHALPGLFLVMATQNPIEQEGTYPLPEAQLDRFLMHVSVGYPEAGAEHRILHLVRADESNRPDRAFSSVAQAHVFAARREMQAVHVSPALEEYLVQLVMATRSPASYGEDLSRWIAWGASPRGTVALDRCSRAHAWLAGRDFATPEDVHAVAADVLRHRVIRSFEAESAGIDADHIVETVLAAVPMP
jgi:MoxR-like ATPase